MTSSLALIEKSYYKNAIFFMKYRTGNDLPELTDDKLMTAFNNIGYVTLSSGDLTVVLMRRYIEFMEKSSTFGQAVLRALKSHKPKEIYVSIMIPNTNEEFSRIGGYLNNFSSLMAQNYPDAYAMLLYRGMFAFNPFKHGTPMLHKDGASKNQLFTRKINDRERALYQEYISLSNIPKIQADDPMCIWNGYRPGDVVMAESSSLTTIKAQMYYRIIPVAALSTKATQSEEGIEQDE